MNILLRLLTGAGIFALGYYIGREVGKVDTIRKELAEKNGDAVKAAGDRATDNGPRNT